MNKTIGLVFVAMLMLSIVVSANPFMNIEKIGQIAPNAPTLREYTAKALEKDEDDRTREQQRAVEEYKEKCNKHNKRMLRVQEFWAWRYAYTVIPEVPDYAKCVIQ